MFNNILFVSVILSFITALIVYFMMNNNNNNNNNDTNKINNNETKSLAYFVFIFIIFIIIFYLIIYVYTINTNSKLLTEPNILNNIKESITKISGGKNDVFSDLPEF